MPQILSYTDNYLQTTRCAWTIVFSNLAFMLLEPTLVILNTLPQSSLTWQSQFLPSSVGLPM